VDIIFDVKGSAKVLPPFERKVNNVDDFLAISNPKIILNNPPVNANDMNIILFSVDTLRADHLGCYGYRRKDISPYIDALAKNGVLFENAISQAPWTAPSHMSIFTSLLPSYHRVNKSVVSHEHFLELMKEASINNAKLERGYRILSENITTLPEVLKSAGYLTRAFTGGGHINGATGFCKGFDTYGNESLIFSDKEHFSKVTKWLKKNKKQKFFLFLHTYKTHIPYEDTVYADEVMSKSVIEELKNMTKLRNAKEIKNTREFDSIIFKEFLERKALFSKKILETLYDGEVNEADRYIGALIGYLKKTGILNKTIIVFTSDHGEEFCDHSKNFYNSHGTSLYNEIIHVPLMFFIPGLSKNVRIKQQVRLIDIMPTLLDIVGIDYDANKMQGTSLLSILKGDKTDKHLVAISESVTNDNVEQKSIRTNKVKYIYTVKIKNDERILVSKKPDREELYDLVHDPKEQYNIFSSEQNLGNVLRKKINKILKKALVNKTKVRTMKIDKNMRNSLKSLGYIQ